MDKKNKFRYIGMDEHLKILANDVVQKICRKVNRASSTEFQKLGKTIGLGASGTTTKYIDKLAEDVAIAILEQSSIQVNLLSEEAGFIDYGGTYTFVLDPVDGTRNAYRGIPFYAVSIGIGRSKLSDIEYGVVKNIPTSDLFQAEKGHGAFYNGRQIHVCEMPSHDMMSSLALGKNRDDITLHLSGHHNVRALGSASLEMCMVATGALDYYVVGHDHLRIIDIAASTLIVREAGGVVTDIFGENLDMQFDLHERTSLVAACSQELLQKIISNTKDK